MVEIQIPQLGQTNLKVTIENWFAKEGDHVEKGVSLYELSNEKLSQEIDAPVNGTLTKILVEEGGVVTNGMSYRARDGKNANSAIAVSVLPEDFGKSIRGAVDLQRKIERAAFERGGRTYAAPAETVGDFLSGDRGTPFTDVMPTYMNGNVVRTDFDGVLPSFVISSLKEGILSFDKMISGFAKSSAVLTAPETRTSSPIRILRDETFVAAGFDNVYPCGEGAGYAGGITSAGVDGINCALKIMGRYAPPKI